ncbi:TPA: hypothetical protein N0F65_012471 [Lagenidium giganteum]|uniref:Gluconokinase n=1 Tax=Lagenidium giganteum TaxID=4803 RepID=A0AAV2YBH7_9STRA|nr:TPA: hypothetical protein N0F65_012471 [Lagenidium giganteum]
MKTTAATTAAAVVSLTALGVAVAGRLLHVHRKKEEHAQLLRGVAQPQRYRASPVVIVIDIGSSSVRASCFALVRDGDRAEWVLVAGSMKQTPLDCIDQHGCAQIAPVAQAVEEAMDHAVEFLRVTGLAANVAGVGFSTFVMNFLGVDAAGAPITPIFTYAGRRAETAECARHLREVLHARGSEHEFHDRTGTVVHPAYAAAEFLRLHRDEPSLVERVHKWQSISGVLLSKWLTHSTTYLPISFTEASWMGLLDFRRKDWDHHLLELVHMPLNKMPPVQDSSEPFTGLNTEFGKRWPELQSTPFFLGIGDGAAANIGSKCASDARIAVTVGTSAAVRVVLPSSHLDTMKVPKGLWCYRIAHDRVLLGGALNDGGSVHRWFSETMALPKDVEKQLERMQPTQSGLTVLPFLSGERAPGWVEDAKCTITGINKWTTAVDMLHAGLESVVLRISLIHSLLAPSVQPNAFLVASGTALTSSPVWRQMIADAVGKELVLEPSATEATSRGIAVFLGVYLGLHTYEASQVLDVDVLRSSPNANAHAAYLDARHAQEDAYRKIYSRSQP